MRAKPLQFVALIVSTLVTVRTAPANGQETLARAAPCISVACGLVVDWGTGRTAGSYNADPRYGSGDDFESGIRRALIAHGVTVRMVQAPFTITVRPKVNSRAMCDQLPGTSTRYSCTVVTDAAVNFSSSDSVVKAPGALRLSNRCAGGTAYVTMGQFGQYIGEMIWLSISPTGANEKKPAMRC